VVRRGDDDGPHVLVVEQAAEVGVAAGGAADLAEGLVAAAAVALGDGDQVGVVLRLEVEDVPLSDEAVADEADADALVGAEDAPPTGGGEQAGAGGHERPAAGRVAGRGRRGGFHAGDPNRPPPNRERIPATPAGRVMVRPTGGGVPVIYRRGVRASG